MKLLDGLFISNQIKKEIAQEVELLKRNGKKIPHLAAVIVGNNGASLSYVSNKVKSCKEVGFNSTLIHKAEETTEQELLDIVKKLNEDEDIDGYIVQLPLPKHIDENKILLAIRPSKDVDGFHPENVGRMALNLPGFLPATPAGILELLKRYEIPTEGKSCLVIGRSNIVGLPMTILMQRNANPGNSTVTIAHSRTKDIKKLSLEADIIIVAIGKPEFLKADMVKEGAVVVDVGISRVEDAAKKIGFRLVGDVKFDEVAPKCSFITPVPGGVGPMTIVSLMKNTLLAGKNR